jgi:hypothetical protein
MDDVELRFALLERAKEIVMREWEHRLHVEESVAKFENRPPTTIRQPTLHRVMSLAEKFYGFVKSPPENPKNPLAPKVSLGSVTEDGSEDSLEDSGEIPEEAEDNLEDNNEFSAEE